MKSEDFFKIHNKLKTYNIEIEDEYIIDKGTLSKVIDVKVDRDNDVAILTLALVPKNIYDKCYSQNRTALKTN